MLSPLRLSLIAGLLLPVFARAEVQVRGLSHRDVPELQAIDPSFQPAPMAGDERTDYVAHFDGRVLGAYSLDRSTGEFALRVNPEYARFGVADALLKSLLNSSRSLDRYEVSVPSAAVDEAQALKAHGFEAMGEAGGRTTYRYLAAFYRPSTVAELESKTLYERLGLNEDATPEQVVKSHDRLAQANEGNRDVLRLLAQSKDVLTHSEKRALYDEKDATFGPLPEMAWRAKLSGSLPGQALRTPRPTSPELYRRLGLFENASPAQVHSAYDITVDWIEEKYRSSPGWRNRMLDSAAQAYAILARGDQRALYDRVLQRVHGVLDPALKDYLDSIPPQGLPSTLERMGFDPHAFDAYKNLGLQHDATPRQIQVAYERLSRRYPGLDYRFPTVAKAYNALSNPNLKQIYDDSFGNLTPRDSHALVERMWEDEDHFIERAEIERRLMESMAPELKAPPKEPKIRSNRTSYLYSALGLNADADEEAIEKAHARFAPHDSDTLENQAHYILSDRARRAQYDKLVLALQGETLHTRRTAIANFIRLCRISDLIADSTFEVPVFAEFVGKALPNAFALEDAPQLAVRFLDRLDILYGSQTTPPDKATLIRLLDVLNNVTMVLPDKRFHSRVHQIDLKIRTAIVTNLEKQGVKDGEFIADLLRRYLMRRPPDFVSNRLRALRDSLQPAPQLEPFEPCAFKLLSR